MILRKKSKKIKIIKKPDFIFKEYGNLLKNHIREWRFDFKNEVVQLISYYISFNKQKHEILRKNYDFNNKYLPKKIKEIIESKKNEKNKIKNIKRRNIKNSKKSKKKAKPIIF